MNERIKQIWEDSEEIKVRYPEQGSPVNVSEQTLEKFAELIVRDSIKKILEWKNEPFPFDEDTAVWILKKHFEIE